MCKCTPEKRTPFCGAPGCEWPEDMPKEFEGMDFDEMAAAMGERAAEVKDWLMRLRTVHEIAQAQMLLVVERAADIEVDPLAGLLALKFVVDLNVEANVARGMLDDTKIELARQMSEMLRNDDAPHKQMIFETGKEPRVVDDNG